MTIIKLIERLGAPTEILPVLIGKSYWWTNRTLEELRSVEGLPGVRVVERDINFIDKKEAKVS